MREGGEGGREEREGWRGGREGGRRGVERRKTRDQQREEVKEGSHYSRERLYSDQPAHVACLGTWKK